MPTPSSDQPPDPPSPHSHGFSTCPDELQNTSSQEWEDVTNRDASRSHEIHVQDPGQPLASVGFVESISAGSGNTSSPRTREPIVTSEDRASLDPSSRATTMSPRPHSSATAGTSPASETVVDELNKRTQVDDHIVLSRVAAEQARSGFGLSGRRSPDHARNATSQGTEIASASLDDELYGPSMGSQFPSMRVSRPLCLAESTLTLYAD